MRNLFGIKNINCHSELTRKSVELAKPDFLFLLGDSESINLMDNRELALIDFGSESGMTRGRGKCVVTPPEFLSSQSSLRNSALPVQGGRKFAKAGFTLAEGATHVGLPPIIAKAGFTLAEVLITLGIIGVVAAMTIPNLMTKIQWIQLHASFKHAYSTLSNALQLTLNNEETSEACYYSYDSKVSGYATNLTMCNQFFKNFEKNLKVMQVCNGNALNNGCIIKYKGQEEVQNIVDNEEALEYFNKNCGAWSANSISNINRVVVLIDGTVVVYYSRASMPLFMVDTNGRKGPNKWGYDIFVFSVKEAQSGAVYLAASNNCMVVEKGGKTCQQMLTRNK